MSALRWPPAYSSRRDRLASENQPFGFDTPKPQPPKVQETIYDLLSVGPTSPGRRLVGRAGCIGDVRALDAAQNASPPREDESAYWMRRIVVQALAEEHTTYAMNQLAAIYGADASKKENVRRMEMIWQLLAVAGNSTAMCNIGLMYKDGIGVPKDSRLARQWYERAQAAGLQGCLQGARRSRPIAPVRRSGYSLEFDEE